MLLNHIRYLLVLEGFLLSSNWLEPCNDLGVLFLEGLGFGGLFVVELLEAEIVLAGLFVFKVDVVEFLYPVFELLCDILNLFEQHWILLVDHF